MEPFIFLHTIPMGKKEKVFPRILPESTRTHNALNLIVSQAFQQRNSFRFFYISLAHSIIENSMPNNIHTKKVKEIIEIAEFNKKNIKHSKKKKGTQMISKIRRRERFKLFKKIKVWK